MLAKVGYTQIETFGAQYEAPTTIANTASELGLSIPTGHFGLQMLTENLENVIEIAKKLGMKLVVCPYLDASERPDTEFGWSEIGLKLENIAGKLSKNNLGLAWHNHDFEFVPMNNGILPLDKILESAPSVSWEADLAWVVMAGFDPFEAIDRFKSRISAVHIKDIAPSGEAKDEDGWADVGFGTMDWSGLIDSLESTNLKYYIVEHDNPNDVERFAKRSFEKIQKLI